MKIMIVGGHAKAHFLTKALKENGHQVTVVNKDKEFCRLIAHTYDGVGVYGDGTKPFILRDAGVMEMDTVIALCTDDSSNLVICEIAKKQFKVKNTFAVVNDPKNVRVFKRLGVDKVISSTGILTDMLEYEAVIDNLINYLPLENEKIIVSEYIVDVRSPISGKSLNEVQLPRETVIPYLMRDEKVISVGGTTIFTPGDRVIIICQRHEFDAVTRLFYWR